MANAGAADNPITVTAAPTIAPTLLNNFLFFAVSLLVNIPPILLVRFDSDQSGGVGDAISKA